MLQARAQWLLPNTDLATAELLVRELQIPPLLSRILIQRGITEAEHARRFLYPNPEQLYSPFILSGMDESVQKLRVAMEQNKTIAIFSAESTDAICASSLLIHTIRKCNGVVYPLAPDEFEEARNMEASLAISVGLSSDVSSQIDGLGLERVDVKETHSGVSTLGLAISGVALKLAHGLLGEIPYDVMDLAAIGTIAGGVTLLEENRIIVKAGLDYLARTKNPGLRSLKKIGGAISSLNTEQIQSLILPRLENGKEALSLLTMEDEEKALALAESMTASAAITETGCIREIQIDAFCDITEINLDTFELLNQLPPFGPGNQSPILAIHQVELSGLRSLGLDHRDFKCICKHGEGAIEAIGLELGPLIPSISKHAIADIIGEIAVYEWNGMRKPQFWIHDLKIDHMQIFDLRGTKEKAEKLAELADRDSVVTYFRPKSMKELEHFSPSVFSIVDGDKPGNPMLKRVSNLFLYDMPYSMDQLKEIMDRLPSPERIYCLFGQEYTSQLAAIPSRDQFKWLYAMILQRGALKVDWIPKLSKAKGISEYAVRFMLKVFLELGFVKQTEETEFIPVPSPEKKDLSQSILYRRKKQELELETELLYSSFDVLCRALNKDRIIYN